jgi:L-iditol 2-dehydrogenase
MMAWVLRGIDDLRFEDVPIPKINAGEALIKIKSVGVCSSDLPRIFTTGAYRYPIILGHEFSGTVDAVHDEKDTAWVGKRVAVFPLLPCFECRSCADAHYETCANYSYIGSRQNGALAEYLAVPVWNLIELPENVNFDEAALFEPAAVALHAVRRLDIGRTRNAAVIGSGPIGLLIAQWLGIYGVRNVAVLGRNDSNVSVDASFEAAGSAAALERCIECAWPNGQIISVGNPDADFRLEQRAYWQILRKQLTIRGTWNSSFASDWQEVSEYAKTGRLRLNDLISHRFEFNKLSAALNVMNNRTQKRCKVILTLP